MTEKEYRCLENLYKAVLQFAIKDAVSSRVTKGGKKPVKYTRDAIEWILGDSEMFNLCCMCANVTPNQVRRKVEELKNKRKENKK